MTVSVTLSGSFSLALSLSRSLSLSFSLSLTHSHSLSRPFSLSLALSLSLSLACSLVRSLALSLSLCLARSLSLSLSLYHQELMYCTPSVRVNWFGRKLLEAVFGQIHMRKIPRVGFWPNIHAQDSTRHIHILCRIQWDCCRTRRSQKS